MSQVTNVALQEVAKKIADAVAKNASATPELCFSPIYFGLQDFTKESTEAVEVMRLLETCEWKLTRLLPWSALTDEANAEMAWSVERQQRPFCNKKGERVWFGPTAIQAMRTAVEAMKGAE